MAADNTPVRVLYVKIHLDEANVVIDYEMGEKDLKPPEL